MVAFGPELLADQRPMPGRMLPVDRATVQARYVVPQRVEFRSVAMLLLGFDAKWRVDRGQPQSDVPNRAHIGQDRDVQVERLHPLPDHQSQRPPPSQPKPLDPGGAAPDRPQRDRGLGLFARCQHQAELLGPFQDRADITDQLDRHGLPGIGGKQADCQIVAGAGIEQVRRPHLGGQQPAARRQQGVEAGQQDHEPKIRKAQRPEPVRRQGQNQGDRNARAENDDGLGRRPDHRGAGV